MCVCVFFLHNGAFRNTNKDPYAHKKSIRQREFTQSKCSSDVLKISWVSMATTIPGTSDSDGRIKEIVSPTPFSSGHDGNK